MNNKLPKTVRRKQKKQDKKRAKIVGFEEVEAMIVTSESFLKQFGVLRPTVPEEHMPRYDELMGQLEVSISEARSNMAEITKDAGFDIIYDVINISLADLQTCGTALTTFVEAVILNEKGE